ncbi:hypothetical protein [Stenotrophomonas maltophilia]|uniref:hypothetical protein n=2 Tax=Stenotrophomonas maltophilia TaxID=40324 RepID=UPI00378701BD
MVPFVRIGRLAMPFTRLVSGWHLDIDSQYIAEGRPLPFWRAEVEVWREGDDAPAFRDHTMAHHASQDEAERIAEGLGTDYALAHPLDLD